MTYQAMTMLRSSVEQGQYEIDSRAIAEKIVRSWVLVSTQVQRPAGGVGKHQAIAR
jgi:hypothetical protein